MIPSAFVLLDGLPLTPNGKVDRAVLPAPDPIRPELEYTFVAPRTRVEEAIAHTWAQVLGIGRVGANDNFFALGGHSLLAAYVIDQINETFLMELPLRHLFEAPTVAGLAQVVEQTKAAEADSTMAQLLATIEQLSADEVQALLAGEHTQGE